MRRIKVLCGLAVGLTAALALGAAPALASAPAGGQTYSDTFTVDPSTFGCGYFAKFLICGSSATFSDAPRMINTGDHLTETVNYTTPLHVPGSTTYSQAGITLFNSKTVGGTLLAGPDTATVSADLAGYSEPTGASLFTGPFSEALFNEYSAIATTYGATQGFDITGMTGNFDITNGDPTPFIGAFFVSSAVLPATPEVLNSFPGGTVGHPVILPTGLQGAVSSDISGGVSDQQFYAFNWDGGLFQTSGTIDGANPLADFHFELLTPGDATPIEDIILNDANNFSGVISVPNLASGQYEIGMYTDSPYDPHYTINFNTPVRGVPEPATWASLILGLGAVGSALRRRRTAPA